MSKIILDLCGGTGSWSKPYREAGYDVRVITLPDYDVEATHIEYYDYDHSQHFTFRGGSAEPMKVIMQDVYGILAAPPCTMFSFARTNAKKPRDLGTGIETVEACERIIRACQLNIASDAQKYPPLKFWALENPKGMLEWFLGRPTYTFSPYEFGDAYKKTTQLWGHFNPPLKSHTDKPNVPKFDYMKSKDIHPEHFGKHDRQTRRSITPSGFAKAFKEANE